MWGWIVASLFFVPTWLGAILALVALLVGWQAAAASAYPAWTIGTKRRVDVSAIGDETDLASHECGRPAAGGERRRYTSERVLFGTVVARPVVDENDYWPSCAVDPGPSGRDGETTERTEETATRRPDHAADAPLDRERK